MTTSDYTVSVSDFPPRRRTLSAQYPDRVFLDQACRRKLPIDLPPLERRRVHGIAVALGAFSACQDYCNDDDGSLMVLSHLKGDEHLHPAPEKGLYFSIGDVNPLGNFIHVFDKTALDLVMLEMSTITDFILYLTRRAEAIRTKGIAWASGEADMLGSYMQTWDRGDGSNTFPTATHMGVDGNTNIMIARNEYTAFIASEAYRGKKLADKVSYNWDNLINLFLDHIMAETTVAVEGYGDIMGAKVERGLRLMACENRFSRRILAQSFLEFIRKSRENSHARFARIGISNTRNGFTGTPVIYIFLMLSYPKDVTLQGGYDQYRQVRMSMLETYCYSALYDHRHLSYAVGIAMDGPSSGADRRSSSEDFMALHVDDWTPELEADVQSRRALQDIMQKDSLDSSRVHQDEYPARDGVFYENRQQRRAAERKFRKKQR